MKTKTAIKAGLLNKILGWLYSGEKDSGGSEPAVGVRG
jgi:hypothetical protein